MEGLNTKSRAARKGAQGRRRNSAYLLAVLYVHDTVVEDSAAGRQRRRLRRAHWPLVEINAITFKAVRWSEERAVNGGG